ncbi:MAG: tRNA pseudouridine(38-40) synthase TruA [Bacteroidetes bacterium]|nr:MAG: tRNA pseudouridine(38-40) synthase TruA [Bacteroidota bacterium]
MYRYVLHLAYNGKAYHGWQRQPGAISVQEVMEECLQRLVEKEINVVGAGRTDTGVHAADFYLHFDTVSPLPPGEEAQQLLFKINRFLPGDIVVYGLFRAATDFHARFSALSRQYVYRIARVRDPFAQDFSHEIYGPLDVEAMNRACEILFAYKDFSCFSKSHTQTKTNNCTIMDAHWKRVGDKLTFTIEADRFLRNMVRAIVGTLLEVGKGKMGAEEMHGVIRSKDRGKAGTSVPAQALFLTRISYPPDSFHPL